MRFETWKLGPNFSHAVKARKLGRAIVLAFINIREVLVPLGDLKRIQQNKLPNHAQKLPVASLLGSDCSFNPKNKFKLNATIKPASPAAMLFTISTAG